MSFATENVRKVLGLVTSPGNLNKSSAPQDAVSGPYTNV